MKEIKRWFQGIRVCGGERKGEYISGHGLIHYLEPGDGYSLCLALACTPREEIVTLARIISRMFPERACQCSQDFWTQVVHFNNHPETTRDQIDKIVHEYKMEVGNA